MSIKRRQINTSVKHAAVAVCPDTTAMAIQKAGISAPRCALRRTAPCCGALAHLASSIANSSLRGYQERIVCPPLQNVMNALDQAWPVRTPSSQALVAYRAVSGAACQREHPAGRRESKSGTTCAVAALWRVLCKGKTGPRMQRGAIDITNSWRIAQVAGRCVRCLRQVFPLFCHLTVLVRTPPPVIAGVLRQDAALAALARAQDADSPKCLRLPSTWLCYRPCAARCTRPATPQCCL